MYYDVDQLPMIHNHTTDDSIHYASFTAMLTDDVPRLQNQYDTFGSIDPFPSLASKGFNENPYPAHLGRRFSAPLPSHTTNQITHTNRPGHIILGELITLMGSEFPQ